MPAAGCWQCQGSIVKTPKVLRGDDGRLGPCGLLLVFEFNKKHWKQHKNNINGKHTFEHVVYFLEPADHLHALFASQNEHNKVATTNGTCTYYTSNSSELQHRVCIQQQKRPQQDLTQHMQTCQSLAIRYKILSYPFLRS